MTLEQVAPFLLAIAAVITAISQARKGAAEGLERLVARLEGRVDRLEEINGEKERRISMLERENITLRQRIDELEETEREQSNKLINLETVANLQQETITRMTDERTEQKLDIAAAVQYIEKLRALLDQAGADVPKWPDRLRSYLNDHEE